jgi:hypothetical protein
MAGGPPHWHGATYETVSQGVIDGTVLLAGMTDIKLTGDSEENKEYYAKLKGQKFRVTVELMPGGEAPDSPERK